MTIARRMARPAILTALILWPTSSGWADITVSGGFSSTGSVGFAGSNPSQTITYGSDGQGSVAQMDGFVNASNYNQGTGADLDGGPPAGIAYSFSATQPTIDQLLLSYQLTNNTGNALQNFQFLYYVDPDDRDNNASDDPPDNTYEYGRLHGALGLGPPYPTSFQVNDANYGSILYNASQGMLDDTNHLNSASTLGDLSAALGFDVGTLGAGQTTNVDILLSDDGSTLGNFAITQVSTLSDDSLTISGSVVPEPSSIVLLGIGSAAIGVAAWRRTGRARAQACTRSQ